MKRSELERYLRENGCQKLREGGKHSVWERMGTEKKAAVPRHNDIKRNTARRICDDLGIPRPPGF